MPHPKRPPAGWPGPDDAGRQAAHRSALRALCQPHLRCRPGPLLAATTAVREDRIVVVPQTILLSPSLLNPRAVALVAAAVTAAA